jgi:predicted Rossmann-fold nucleotide-binding protein
VLAENRFSITERFMDERHRAMWQVVEQPEQVVGALANATPWFPSARSFAAQ